MLYRTKIRRYKNFIESHYFSNDPRTIMLVVKISNKQFTQC